MHPPWEIGKTMMLAACTPCIHSSHLPFGFVEQNVHTCFRFCSPDTEDHKERNTITNTSLNMRLLPVIVLFLSPSMWGSNCKGRAPACLPYLLATNALDLSHFSSVPESLMLNLKRTNKPRVKTNHLTLLCNTCDHAPVEGCKGKFCSLT